MKIVKVYDKFDSEYPYRTVVLDSPASVDELDQAADAAGLYITVTTADSLEDTLAWLRSPEMVVA